MNALPISLIRDSISAAIAAEAQSETLLRFLEDLTPKLHQAIKLPEDQPARYLLNFVKSYIQQVPDFIEALTELMTNSEQLTKSQALLTIVIDFFLQPDPITQSDSGLYALLDKAYLAHRFFEEINDRILMASGVPLIPIDMTLANIIVHDLLGEGYANQLDLIVHFSVESLISQINPAQSMGIAEFVREHKQENWDPILREWPTLTENSSVLLRLNSAVTHTAKLH